MKGGLARPKISLNSKNETINENKKTQPITIEQLIISNNSNLGNEQNRNNKQEPLINLIPANPPVCQNSTKKSQQQDKHHYCIEINNIKIHKNKKIVEPIIGKAILDSNLVNYLCDGGADISIINENLFNKLKINPQNEITPYQGNPLHSCSGEIRVLGTINIK